MENKEELELLKMLDEAEYEAEKYTYQAYKVKK